MKGTGILVVFLRGIKLRILILLRVFKTPIYLTNDNMSLRVARGEIKTPLSRPIRQENGILYESKKA